MIRRASLLPPFLMPLLPALLLVPLVIAPLVLTASLAEAAGDYKNVEGPARVLDGGTLVIGDHTLRLHGIIAPAARQKCLKGALPWLCGAAARGHLVERVAGKTVRCEKQGAHTARCLAGQLDLSRDMVRAGWAVADEAGADYRADEETARAEKLGLWKYTE